MKIFLSWSGDVSQQVAETLHDWLPNVIQALDPWMSSTNIPKGTFWSTELADNLTSIKAGIICVTPDNQNAPYLNFEAGALAKTVDKPMVCTYLIGMKPSEVKGPLSNFQSTEANKEDTFKMLETLNKALGDKALSEAKLASTFERWWPDLDKDLARIISAKPLGSAERSVEDMVEEILDIVRDIRQGRIMELTQIQNELLNRYQELSTDVRGRPDKGVDFIFEHSGKRFLGQAKTVRFDIDKPEDNSETR